MAARFERLQMKLDRPFGPVFGSMANHRPIKFLPGNQRKHLRKQAADLYHRFCLRVEVIAFLEQNNYTASLRLF